MNCCCLLMRTSHVFNAHNHHMFILGHDVETFLIVPGVQIVSYCDTNISWVLTCRHPKVASHAQLILSTRAFHLPWKQNCKFTWIQKVQASQTVSLPKTRRGFDSLCMTQLTTLNHNLLTVNSMHWNNSLWLQQCTRVTKESQNSADNITKKASLLKQHTPSRD